MENYTATEGNFAYQYLPDKKGMELICNEGIFYEFIAFENEGIKDAERICLQEVELNRQYVMVISNTSGLWAYRMNDIVCFVGFRFTVNNSLNIARMKIQHICSLLLSAFTKPYSISISFLAFSD